MSKVIRIFLFSVIAIIRILVVKLFPDIHGTTLWIMVDSRVLSVIPFLQESLKSLKQKSWFTGVPIYFLAQYRGTFLILSGVVLRTIASVKGRFGVWCICAGFGLKLGLFPFNFWVNLSFINFHYLGVFIAGTAQKIFIIFAVPFLTTDPICGDALYLISLMSILWGAFGMLISIEVKPFLGYMSLNYTGCLTLCADHDIIMACQYAGGYSLTVFFLRLILSQRNCRYLRDLRSKMPLYYKAGFFFLAFRISGFPPFIEFSVKYAIISLLWRTGFHFTVYLIIVANVIIIMAWLSIFPFTTANIFKPLEFSGRVNQNILNIICIIWSIFRGFRFGIL